MTKFFQNFKFYRSYDVISTYIYPFSLVAVILVTKTIQCSSEISEPKCARKTRIIHVCVHVYTHTHIDI